MAKSSKGKGRGHKISKVKRNNQIKTKMIKQGKLKGQNKSRNATITRRPVKNPPRPEPVPEEESEDDMMDMIESEDVDFLHNAAASRSYSLLKRIRFNKPREDGPRKKKARGSDEENDDAEQMEENYDELMRNAKADHKPERELLPIKTKDGLVRRTTTEMIKKLKPERAAELIEKGGIIEESEEANEELEVVEEVEDSKLDLTEPISVAQMLALRSEQLSKYRLRIGCLASGVLEDPSGKLGNLKFLLSFLTDKQPIEVAVTVPRLAAVSLLEVFKDLLPEYQIKNFEDVGVKLKKDTLRMRSEENSLLASYKKFLAQMEKLLAPIVKRRGQKNQATPQAVKLAVIALQCMCQMLVARPYFNFAPNIVRLTVPFLNHRLPEAREVVVKSLLEVLKDDRKGELSFEIVRRINALVKAKNHAVRPECLHVLMALRIKDINLDQEKNLEIRQKKLNKKERNLSTSKRDRKRAKRWDELNNELMETKAEENKQTKQKFFTEVTKLVFTIFFRVLKSAPTSKLLTATLEGLAKFAHCINIEFYHDLVSALERLLKNEDQPLSTRHQLLCIQTVFTILSGHGEFLTIDPTSFYALLYRNLLKIHIGRYQNDLKLALEIMNDAVLKKRKDLSQQRLFAFTKRLCTISLMQQHNGTLGCLQLVKSILDFSRSLDVLLEPDTSVGQGVFMPLVEDPEYCNAGNTALYELHILKEHYHPVVRDYARHILRKPDIEQETGQIIKGILSQAVDKMSATEIFEAYNPKDMQFNPSTPAPFHYKPKQRVFFAASNIKNIKMRYLVEDMLEAEAKGKDDYSSYDFASCFKK